MTVTEQLWINAWRRAEVALARVHGDELRAIDHCATIAAFDDAFAAITRDAPPRLTSGLVEQQRRFARLRLAQ
jgi:hypothetical protein